MNNRRVGRVSARALAIGTAAAALAMSAPVAAVAVTPPAQPQHEHHAFRCSQVRVELPRQVIGEGCEGDERGPIYEPFLIVHRHDHRHGYLCRNGYADAPNFVEGHDCRRVDLPWRP